MYLIVKGLSNFLLPSFIFTAQIVFYGRWLMTETIL